MYFRDIEQAFEINDFEYVIVDTDVGGDDCQALITLFSLCKRDNKKLLGVSCCNGNAVIEDVVKNVLITQAICEVSYPVYLGNDSSMSGQNLKDNFFGEHGFGNRQTHYLEKLKNKIDTSLIQQKKSYKFISESAKQYRKKIALVCLGPLSNIALAYHYDNTIVDCFSNVAIMGCSQTLVKLNFYYSAEFNVGLDPEAAYIVFNKFKNIILVSLDTSIIGLDQEKLNVLFNQDHTPKAQLIKNIFTFLSEKQKTQSPRYCDPLTVMVLFRPKCVTEGMFIRLEVEMNGKRTRGSTFVDYFSPNSQNFNCYLVKNFDHDFLVEEGLKCYD